MPIKFVLKFVVAPLLLLTATTTMAIYAVRPESHREPAAIKIQKLGADQVSPEFFDLQITESNTAAIEEAASSFTVTVTAIRSVPAGLSYAWTLPSDARLIAGDLTGSLYALQAGESQQFKIDLAGFSKQQKKFLEFHVTGLVFNQPVKRDLMIASQLENTLEYKIQQAYRHNNNVQNKLGTRENKFSVDNIIK